jgi:PHD/YefM family antitoxin component YafN of YafNO toxin-antitoxin module
MEVTMITTTQAQETAERLRVFAEEVEAMVDLLDNSSSPCNCCGTEKWSDWQQHQLAERLIGIAEKMDNAADLFERRAVPSVVI